MYMYYSQSRYLIDAVETVLKSSLAPTLVWEIEYKDITWISEPSVEQIHVPGRSESFGPNFIKHSNYDQLIINCYDLPTS